MYQAFYKLHGKPFQLTPDPAMLFPSKGHRRAMSYLLYGFEQREGFVVITGAVGTGKTLLIQSLFEQLAHRNIVIASIASANLDGDDILPAVASAFDLPYEQRSKESLLQDVKRYLISLQSRQTHALLVVDEAQTLTFAALEMLRIVSNFQFNGHALLQIFLVGQTELRRTIISNHMEQLRQRIIASHRLDPMSEEECCAYILHRLRAVGWSNDPAMTPEIFSGVYRASRGIPRKINLIMDRLLLNGYLEGLHDLSAAELTMVLDEINEEMAGVPSTLEAPVELDDLDLTRGAAPEKREGSQAELDFQRDKILLQLLREEVRRREMRQGAAPASSAMDQAEDLNPHYPRSGQEGK
ncbi:MAG: XrtA/PEP-CTERM system-associated ATPase [Rhodanobacter sp.]